MVGLPGIGAAAATTGREGALQAALERLGAGQMSDRSDTPDLHVTAFRRLPALPAQYAPFPATLDQRLRQALASRGVFQLYTHQADAIDRALAGRSLVIATPTSSGKTLCYNAPILHSILQDPSSRALYLFPTKALAQDQLAELQGMCEALAASSGDQIGVFTYDGDTPQDARRTIRARAHLVLSNPDMLHSGILPHHPRWAKLFENLRYVVIDELHAYRGVFGSHLCNVLRRLRRVCRHYGSDPVLLCSSATIANPRELAERLAERPVEVIDQSGAPRGEKFFVFVNPPVVNRQLGIRRSYLGEARRIASEFLKRNLQIIVFAQSRLATEILTTYLKDDFEDVPGAPERIRGYRGGYLPQRRREIERGLREGVVRAVVSTNALELGIDIGALDVSVMAGYPGTIAATWQRAGRAGRRASRSAAIMVASSAPIDQFVIRNPSYFFDASPERALIDPDNLHILVDHVKCAAFELPFTTTEQFGRYDVQEILGVLAEQGLVWLSRGSIGEAEALGGGVSGASGEAGAPREAQRWTWTTESYPADAVSLRSVSSDNFVVVDTTRETRVIGETDFRSGPATLHPKAIYIVEGKLYQVERLDFEGRKAFVREIDCDYYTDAITYSRVTVLDDFAGGGSQPSPQAESLRSRDTEAVPASGSLEPLRGAQAPSSSARGGVPGAIGEAGAPRAYGSACGPREDSESAERRSADGGVPNAAAALGCPNGGGAPRAYGSACGPREDSESASGAARASGGGAPRAYGEVHVVSRVVGFKKIKFYTNENVGSGELDLPEQQMHTTSYWLTLPAAVMTQLPFAVDDRRDGVVGLAFAMKQVAQLLLMCDRHDIGVSIEAAGASGGDQDQRIFIYDSYPGGIGFSEPLYRMHDELVGRTHRLIAECGCQNGCPACVGPVGDTGPLAKAAALGILDLLLASFTRINTT